MASYRKLRTLKTGLIMGTLVNGELRLERLRRPIAGYPFALSKEYGARLLLTTEQLDALAELIAMSREVDRLQALIIDAEEP